MAEPEKSQKRQSSYAETAHFNVVRQRLTEGDTSVWEELDSKYRERAISLLAFIDKGLAEDAWQETLLKLVRDPSVIPAVMKGDDIWPWLITVARSKIFDLLRKNRHHNKTQTFNQSQHEVIESSESLTLDEIIGSEDVERINCALNKLDEKYRIVIQRHYFAGEALREIASDLGIPSETVRTWHARARAQLKQMLSGGDND